MKVAKKIFEHYDDENDIYYAYYIGVKTDYAEVFETDNYEIVVDIDKDGKVVGVEIIGLSNLQKSAVGGRENETQ